MEWLSSSDESCFQGRRDLELSQHSDPASSAFFTAQQHPPPPGRRLFLSSFLQNPAPGPPTQLQELLAFKHTFSSPSSAGRAPFLRSLGCKTFQMEPPPVVTPQVPCPSPRSGALRSHLGGGSWRAPGAPVPHPRRHLFTLPESMALDHASFSNPLLSGFLSDSPNYLIIIIFSIQQVFMECLANALPYRYSQELPPRAYPLPCTFSS